MTADVSRETSRVDLAHARRVASRYRGRAASIRDAVDRTGLDLLRAASHEDLAAMLEGMAAELEELRGGCTHDVDSVDPRTVPLGTLVDVVPRAVADHPFALKVRGTWVTVRGTDRDAVLVLDVDGKAVELLAIHHSVRPVPVR